MSPQAIEKRVESLEQRVMELDGLPERVGAVEAQIVQFRAEVHDEFSAVRSEMATEFAAVRGEMKAEFAAVRGEMKAEFAAVRGEMQAEFAAVRGEIEETRRFMRVLHEEVLSRIATIGERPRPARQPRKKRSS